MPDIDLDKIGKIIESAAEASVKKVAEGEKAIEAAETKAANNVLKHTEAEIRRIRDALKKEVKSGNQSTTAIFLSDLIKINDDISNDKSFNASLRKSVKDTIDKAKNEFKKQGLEIDLSALASVSRKDLADLATVNEELTTQKRIRSEISDNLDREIARRHELERSHDAELKKLEERSRLENKMILSRKKTMEVASRTDNDSFPWSNEKRGVLKKDLKEIYNELVKIAKLSTSSYGPAAALTSFEDYVNSPDMKMLNRMIEGKEKWNQKYATEAVHSTLNRLRSDSSGVQYLGIEYINYDDTGIEEINKGIENQTEKIERLNSQYKEANDTVAELQNSQRRLNDLVQVTSSPIIEKEATAALEAQKKEINSQEKLNSSIQEQVDLVEKLLHSYAELDTVGKSYDEILKNKGVKRAYNAVKGGKSTYEDVIPAIARNMGGYLETYQENSRKFALGKEYGLDLSDTYWNQRFDNIDQVNEKLTDVRATLSSIKDEALEIQRTKFQMKGIKTVAGKQQIMSNREYVQSIHNLIKENKPDIAAYLFDEFKSNYPKSKSKKSTFGRDFDINYDKYLREGQQKAKVFTDPGNSLERYQMLLSIEDKLILAESRFSREQQAINNEIEYQRRLGEELAKSDLSSYEARQKALELYNQKLEEARAKLEQLELIDEEFNKSLDVDGRASIAQKYNVSDLFEAKGPIAAWNKIREEFLGGFSDLYGTGIRVDNIKDIILAIESIDDLSKSTDRTSGILSHLTIGDEEYSRIIEIANILKNPNVFTPGGNNYLLNALGITETTPELMSQIIDLIVRANEETGKVIGQQSSAAGQLGITYEEAAKELLALAQSSTTVVDSTTNALNIETASVKELQDEYERLIVLINTTADEVEKLAAVNKSIDIKEKLGKLGWARLGPDDNKWIPWEVGKTGDTSQTMEQATAVENVIKRTLNLKKGNKSFVLPKAEDEQNKVLEEKLALLKQITTEELLQKDFRASGPRDAIAQFKEASEMFKAVLSTDGLVSEAGKKAGYIYWKSFHAAIVSEASNSQMYKYILDKDMADNVKGGRRTSSAWSPNNDLLIGKDGLSINNAVSEQIEIFSLMLKSIDRATEHTLNSTEKLELQLKGLFNSKITSSNTVEELEAIRDRAIQLGEAIKSEGMGKESASQIDLWVNGIKNRVELALSSVRNEMEHTLEVSHQTSQSVATDWGDGLDWGWDAPTNQEEERTSSRLARVVGKLSAVRNIPAKYVLGIVHSIEDIEEKLVSEGVPESEISSKAQEIRKNEIDAINQISDGLNIYIHRSSTEILDAIQKSGLIVHDEDFSGTMTRVENKISADEDYGEHRRAKSFAVLGFTTSQERYMDSHFEELEYDDTKINMEEISSELVRQRELEEEISLLAERIDQSYSDNSALSTRLELFKQLHDLGVEYSSIVGSDESYYNLIKYRTPSTARNSYESIANLKTAPYFQESTGQLALFKDIEEQIQLIEEETGQISLGFEIATGKAKELEQITGQISLDFGTIKGQVGLDDIVESSSSNNQIDLSKYQQLLTYQQQEITNVNELYDAYLKYHEVNNAFNDMTPLLLEIPTRNLGDTEVEKTRQQLLDLRELISDILRNSGVSLNDILNKSLTQNDFVSKYDSLFKAQEQASASTNELISKEELLKKVIDSLNISFLGIQSSISQGMNPEKANELFNALTRLDSEVKDLSSSLLPLKVNNLFSPIISQAEQLNNKITALRNSFTQISGPTISVSNVTEENKNLDAAANQTLGSLHGEAGALDDIVDSGEAAADAKKKVKDANVDLNEAAHDTAGGLDSEGESLRNIATDDDYRRLTRLARGFYELSENFIAYREYRGTEQSDKLTGNQISDIEAVINAYQNLRSQLENNIIAEDELTAAQRRFMETVETQDWDKYISKQATALQKLHERLNNLSVNPKFAESFSQQASQVSARIKELLAQLTDYDLTTLNDSERWDIISNIVKAKNEANELFSSEQRAFSTLQQQLESLSSLSNNAFQVGNVNVFLNKIQELRKELQNLTDNWVGNQDQQRSLEALAQKINNLQKAVNQNQKGGWQIVSNVSSTESLDSALKKYLSTINAGKVQIGSFNSGNKSLTATYVDATGKLQNLTARINENIGALEVQVTTGSRALAFLKNYGVSAFNIIKSFARYYSGYQIVFKMISEFKEGVSVLKDFNTGLTTISYTMDLTSGQLSDLGKQAREMASDLSVSLDNAMEIYQIYANMKSTAQEIENIGTPTAILANLSGLDASTAADEIQGVINQFDLSAESAMHIADVYDYISSMIAVDYSKGIESIAEAVETVGNVAYSAGLNFEQLSAIVATTAEQTRQEGSQIGNALKTILVRISKASTMDDEVDNETLSKASKALHEVGVEVYSAQGQFREFDVVMGELAAKWDTLTEAQQANISFQVAATRQTATMRAILQNWTTSMNLATEATNTNGNALKNQEKYEQSYAGKLQAIQNQVDEFWLNLLNNDTFLSILDNIDKLLERINELPAALTAVTTVGLIPMLGIIKKANIKNLGRAKMFALKQNCFEMPRVANVLI